MTNGITAEVIGQLRAAVAERLKCVTGVELMGLHVTTVNLRMASEHQGTDGGWLTSSEPAFPLG
jgi:hypothetical protein